MSKTPSRGALRAARALQNENGRRLLAREEFLTQDEIALLIERETGAAEMLAALKKAEHGFHLLAHNLGLHCPGSSLINWAKDGESDARNAIARALTSTRLDVQPTPEMLAEFDAKDRRGGFEGSST